MRSRSTPAASKSTRVGTYETFSDSAQATAAAWAESLKVSYVPTLVLFDAAGVERLRMEAYFRPFHVAGSLEYVSGGAWQREPSFQRWLQSKGDDMRRRGAAPDLWNLSL